MKTRIINLKIAKILCACDEIYISIPAFNYVRMFKAISKRKLKARLSVKLTSFIDHVTFRTIYIERFERDCDHYEVNWASKFSNIYQCNSSLNDWHECCEGFQSAHRITKAEYDSYQRSERDVAAEQAGY